jgi:hypothetical protein
MFDLVFILLSIVCLVSYLAIWGVASFLACPTSDKSDLNRVPFYRQKKPPNLFEGFHSYGVLSYCLRIPTPPL